MLEGNEEFNLDEVSFKPLTKGLGFHKKDPPKSVISSTQVKPSQTQNKFRVNQALPSKGQESLGTFYEHSNIWPSKGVDDSVHEEGEPNTAENNSLRNASFLEQ